MTSSHRSIDARSGLVINTHDLGRGAGAMREIDTLVDAPEGLGSDVIGVPPNSPIHLELRLEAVVEGVLVTGTAEVDVAGQCGRCLEPVEDDLVIDIQELFVHPGSDFDEDEASRMEGELIDLEPLVRDEVVLEMPLQPLCQEDCAGLCPSCGANLNHEPEHEHRDAIDPRWGDLASWGTSTD